MPKIEAVPGCNTFSNPYYNGSMKATVQARLDAEEKKLLARLTRQLGWTPSKVVREGLRLLAASHANAGQPRIKGLGQFSSGLPDLGSNKKHLRDFGH
jgi:hypothetical protein